MRNTRGYGRNKRRRSWNKKRKTTLRGKGDNSQQTLVNPPAWRRPNTWCWFNNTIIYRVDIEVASGHTAGPSLQVAQVAKANLRRRSLRSEGQHHTWCTRHNHAFSPSSIYRFHLNCDYDRPFLRLKGAGATINTSICRCVFLFPSTSINISMILTFRLPYRPNK